MTASSRIPMSDYLREIKYAVEHIVPTLWHEREELRELEGKVEVAAARAMEVCRRANFAMLSSEDADDLLITHWMMNHDTPPNREWHHLSAEADHFRARLAARAFSTSALAGALLQYAKQGMSAAYGAPGNWPEVRKIGDVSVSVIIRHGRNQAMHWEEGKDPHAGLVECFEKLAELDPVFSKYRERSLAMEVVDLLGWKEYADFERDLLGLGED
ncbi:hypothetical protein ABZS71_06725 [Streptomyces sp. NPDC005393]|uniref:hypothetical protein n=1 Tax=Streptomyces sp. NPDC005393 TaxID=3157041 RepID=UPI0033A942CE